MIAVGKFAAAFQKINYKRVLFKSPAFSKKPYSFLSFANWSLSGTTVLSGMG